jgi:hypothetical protein
MCLAVYIASDRELPLKAFDPAARAFNVKPLTSHEDSVRQQFSLPHVVYAGAQTSCSCGFVEESEDDREASEASRSDLVEYLELALQSGTVEIFTCWEGDQERGPARRLRLSLAQLSQTADWLAELTFVELLP